MTAEDVRGLVEAEINGDWDRPNPHGIDFRRSLVAPQRKDYNDPFNEGTKLPLWLVLEEHPDSGSGYKIVYDESRRMYGLAIVGQQNEGVFIGYYGTFLETLDAM